MKPTARPNLSDADLKSNILTELKYEPSVKSTDIGVVVKDGTVTLTGFTASYWEKTNAVRAAKRVVGVNVIADSIVVQLPSSLVRTDTDIASDATQQFKWYPSFPQDSVQITVRDGWITLEGEVEWRYQKNAAENAVHYLLGVRGVTNEVTIRPIDSSASIETDIRAAFERNAMLDGDEVAVTTTGNSVILRGKVRNNAEKQEAERVAWAAKGVTTVENELNVNWSWL